MNNGVIWCLGVAVLWYCGRKAITPKHRNTIMHDHKFDVKDTDPITWSYRLPKGR